MRGPSHFGLLLLVALVLCCGRTASATRLAAAAVQDAKQPPASLADTSPEEAEALNRLAASRAWTSRALAAMRLERYDCEASAGRLVSMTADASWRVRAYAFAVLGRRGVKLEPATLLGERDPRVMRAIMRARYEIAADEVDARIAALERSPEPMQAMLALEILAARDAAEGGSADGAVRRRMDDLLARVVLRMTRTEAGALSSRLAAITSGDDVGRDYRWREWYRKSQRNPGFQPSALVPTRPAGARLVPLNKVAQLDPAAFVEFEGYLARVGDRPMDLALLIDCTASMWRELADAQSSADALVEFLDSVTGGVRIAIVGYRDRTDAWEMKSWDFTGEMAEARSRLWSLSADGGGDEPESVYAAMRNALTRFTWLPDARAPAPQPIRALVLVGDAPPHPGEGTLCVELARTAFTRGVRTYGIVARERESNLREEGGEIAKRPSAPDGAPPTDGERPKSPSGSRDSPDAPRGEKKPVAPPRPPPPTAQRRPSRTWFPEIAEAGGGRADVIKEGDSLVAEIAELTIADKYRAEFRDFFAAFRLLCR